MSDESKTADEGILDKAKRLAGRVGEYARSDEAREKLDSVKKKAAEVGGMASSGAKRIAEGTKQAAVQARVRADELSKSERVQAIKARAREEWDEIRGGTFRGSRLSENPALVGLTIFFFFPVGLYLLWKHPVLRGNKAWWWAGGAWGLFVTLAALGDKDRAGLGTSPQDNSRLAAEAPAPASIPSGRQTAFNLWTEPLAVLEVDHPDSGNWVRDIDFSPDGRYLITQGRLWATDGWRLLNPEGRPRIHGGLFSPDGRSFASAWGDELLVWTITDDRPEVAENYRLVTSFPSRDDNALGFPYVSCDARWTPYGIAVAAPVPEPGPTGSERLKATEAGRSSRRSAAARMQKISDSSFPFLGAGSKKLSFDVDTPNVDPGCYTFAFSARAHLMARLHGNHSTQAAKKIPGYEELPDRQKFVEVWTWPGNGRPLFRTRVEGYYGPRYENQITFLPDGNTFVMTSSQKDPEGTSATVRHVVLVDTATWKETNRFKSKDINFHIAAVSPDSSRIATASGLAQDFTVTLWSPSSSEPLRVINSLYAYQVLFTPDGRTLITSVEGGGIPKVGKTYHINFYDVASGACTGRIKDRGICSIAVSPDGRYLVSGHSDSTAKVWDLRKGRPAPYEE